MKGVLQGLLGFNRVTATLMNNVHTEGRGSSRRVVRDGNQPYDWLVVG
jgi:ATP-dependent Clp protease adapter protein ClpS